MDADFSIELGSEDPVLDFPWTDPAGRLCYLDLKRNPALIEQIEEAQKFPELGQFLRTLNSNRSLLESAKCDAWATSDLSPEEDIFNASNKFSSYTDLVFTNIDSRFSLAFHEQFARKLSELLRKAPPIPSSVEVLVRRCFFHGGTREIQDGFYFTIYVNGYGSDEESARRSWGVALDLTANAIFQLSAQSQ